MRLTGIIEDVFRGVTIFRGYATLKTLAKLSSTTSYQRVFKDERLDDILHYMKDSQFFFFPELILGWQIENAEAIRKIKEEDTAKITIENGIKIRKVYIKLKGMVDGEDPRTKVVTIEIPDSVGNTIFNRIDGNHRLVVVDKIIQGETEDVYEDICNNIVPYCLIIQNKDNDHVAEKHEAAYFYLINSKAEKLTTDENLKAILSGGFFSSIEKQTLLSLDEKQIQCIEKLSEFLSANSVDFINEEFKGSNYSFSISLVRNIIPQGEFSEERIDETIINAIKFVNCMYMTKKIEVPTKGILLALTSIYCRGNTIFEKFLSWVNKNEVGNIHELSFESIIKLFDNIHKQRAYKVFVAMPYISFKRVNEYNKLFREVLAEISKNKGFGLELIPIMRFRGESQRIDRRLIDKIKECDIFIGDLTTVNDNVIFEIGLAEGNDKKILLIKSEEDTCQLPFDEVTNLDKGKVVPFDLDKLQYIPYSNSGYYNDIKSIMRNNIPVIVEQLKKGV